MAQARVHDYFALKKKSHDAHPSKKRKLAVDDLDPKASLTNLQTLEAGGEQTDGASKQATSSESRKTPTGKRSSRTKHVTPSCVRTRVKAVSRKKVNPAGQIKIQDAFAKAKESSSDEARDKLSSEEELATDDVTVENNLAWVSWDEHDGLGTPKRKTRPTDRPLQSGNDASSESTISVRRKSVARRSKPDELTPKKGQLDEEEVMAARRHSLAQSFKQKLAQAVSGDSKREISSLKEGSLDTSNETSSTTSKAKTTPTKTIACKEQPSLNKSMLPSDHQILLELGPTDPVPISPLPATPKKNSQDSKTVKLPISPNMKKMLEDYRRMQNKDSSSRSSPAQSRNSVRTSPFKGAGDTGCGSKESPTKRILDFKSSTPKSPSKKVLTPEYIRDRLKKCGKLETLKNKLAEMNSTLKVVRKLEMERNQAEKARDELEAETKEIQKPQTAAKASEASSPAGKKTVPAFERYGYLAREGPPTLALPGKYQRLLSTFQGTDTVVSMLYNRQEIITFTKLQAAVQSMTRKNFEQSALGQMKTVYPTCYNFRQESGLPSFGPKVSGYQLTVEPNLEGVEKDGCALNSDGKPNFSASVLLKRKRLFQSTLVDITKNHHADFLSKLTPPMEIPAGKITRWHPRFALDSVPDIEVTDLPAPPFKVYQTAKQVLEAAKGKLPAKVEAAMAKVAEMSSSSQPQPKSTPEAPKATAGSSTPKPTGSAYRGIPLALLEKIRAKEAAKTQASLTRDPKEDKKTEMMGRLPSLIRCLRTFYVTEKKPSLPMATVIEKLSDSYETCISPVDVESHMALLQELAPKWLQVIQIARGKYVKIDKNMDITALIAKITNLAKSRR